MSFSSAPQANVDSTFVCDCGEQSRSACVGEPFYEEHGGKRYCVFHFPGFAKIAAFEEAIEKKLKDGNFNFRRVWFPSQPPFKNIKFQTSVDFNDAFFSRGADFSNTIFIDKASFKNSTFDGAGAGFTEAVFLGEADFSSTTFKLGVGFKKTRFDKKVYFAEAKFYI